MTELEDAIAAGNAAHAACAAPSAAYAAAYAAYETAVHALPEHTAYMSASRYDHETISAYVDARESSPAVQAAEAARTAALDAGTPIWDAENAAWSRLAELLPAAFIEAVGEWAIARGE